MRSIPVFDAADELTHSPGGDPTFQESALFVWHDLASGAGGFWRIGQEAVIAELNSCFGLFTEDGARFRSNVTGAPMAPGDRGPAHMGWGSVLRVDLDTLTIRADFPECKAHLVFQDFHPRYEWFTLINRPLPPGHSPHHWEVAGRVTGSIELAGRRLAIDALGYRDRSWGPRVWNTVRATRWWPVVFGPDLSAFTISSVDRSGRHGAYGYVLRDGQALAMTEVDVTATLAYDAVTPRAAQARFTLENGGTGSFVHEPADGIALHVRGYTAIESIGRVRWGNRTGVSNFEIATNPAGGSEPPVLAFGANLGQGPSRR